MEQQTQYNYPFMELTPEQFDRIPKAEVLSKDFLKYEDIGFKFRCKGSTSVENTVIGEIVRGRDVIAEQFGAGMLDVPERFVNRYRVKIVE